MCTTTHSFRPQASRLCLNTRESLRHGSGGGDSDTVTCWFDDIELHEHPSTARTRYPGIRDVLPLAPPQDSKSPGVTFAQSVSLQRSNSESGRSLCTAHHTCDADGYAHSKRSSPTGNSKLAASHRHLCRWRHDTRVTVMGSSLSRRGSFSTAPVRAYSLRVAAVCGLPGRTVGSVSRGALVCVRIALDTSNCSCSLRFFRVMDSDVMVERACPVPAPPPLHSAKLIWKARTRTRGQPLRTPANGTTRNP